MTSTPGSARPTGAATPPLSEPARPVGRFTRAERWVHRTTAALTLVCVATAAALYVPQIAELVGRRHLVVTVHEWAGILLPAPFLLGLASATFVHDWLALAIGLVLAGHIRMALADPEARRGMRTGSVERPWAEREHPLWLRDEPEGKVEERPDAGAEAG
ncbi:hypothetical protein ACIPWI_23400 [Streptomyces sp. NPDC090046]|uniref:hypothetical protein n=1 Tax=Streptomyces sp. NPDC090046 TaxID=3365928 RepID=UPI00382938F3